MDANSALDKIRHAIGRAQYFSDLGQTGANYTWQLEQAADAFTVLDAHLSAGGTPPEEWREGPDAPGEAPAMSWAEVAERSAAGMCPASPDYSGPHIVTDGRMCDECGADVHDAPDLTEAAYLLRGKLLYAKSEEVTGSSTGDRKWWLEDSEGAVLHDGVYSSLDVLERRHGLAEDQRPPIESL